jgi:tyrosine-protein kinase Etk/Wzc
MPTVDEVGHHVPASDLNGIAPPEHQAMPREFDFLDVFLIAAASKWTILALSAIGLTIGIIAGWIAHPVYTAKTVIMPPQQEQSSSSALMGQFGALASMTGLGSSLNLKNPSDLYIGILQSETVTDRMIKRFDLRRVYHYPKRESDLRVAVAKTAKFMSEKDGMISISVTDRDPRRAADMANAYVQELYDMNNRLALGGAAQKRLFFEQQLAQEKDRLADAEVALRQTEEATGVIAPTGQTENMIRQIAQVEAEITSHEVQLDALKTSSTDQNPDVIRLTTELASLRGQLHDLESGSGKRNPGDISMTAANAPKAGLEYIRKERDVKYHQFLFDMLARQYEAARIDEARAAPVIQVVDPAQVPDRKSAPYRALWALVGCVVGCFASLLWVFLRHIYRKMASDAEHGQRLAQLKQELLQRP